MNRNEAQRKATDMCNAHPPLKCAALAAWDRVAQKIDDRAASTRPKMKVFEVHHQQETARFALLLAIAQGRAPESGEIEALESIGLA